MAAGQCAAQLRDVLPALRVDDQRVVSERSVQLGESLRLSVRNEVRLGEDHDRIDVFELCECQQLIKDERPRRWIVQRGNGDHGVDVGSHDSGAAFAGAPLQHRCTLVYAIDERAAVLEQLHVDAIAGHYHAALCAGVNAFEVGYAGMLLDIEHDPRCVFTDGNHARRERLGHAANDGDIVEWARMLRIDAPPNDGVQSRVAAACAEHGIRARFGTHAVAARTYALLEAPTEVDSADLERALPDARWYAEPIIALAIEPAPADALPHLQAALGGSGAPVNVLSCDATSSELLVEIRASVTAPALVLRLLDVELLRWHGRRRTALMAPLTAELVAMVAGTAMQAPEISRDRLLETLLEALHVE